MVWLLRQREWRLQLQSMWSQRGSGNITSTLASPLFFCLYILKLTFYILIFSFPFHYKSQVTTMLTENPDLSIRVITSDSGGWLVHGENKSFNPKQRWESESWSQPIHTHIFFYWLVPLQKDAGCKVVDQCSPLTASHWWLSTCARPPSRDNHATLRNRIIYVNDVWMNDCWHLIRIYYLPHTTTNTPYCTPNRELVMEKDWEAFIEQVRECS